MHQILVGLPVPELYRGPKRIPRPDPGPDPGRDTGPNPGVGGPRD